MVYDVTRPETFTHLTDMWSKEVEQYSTNQDCIKILAGNKLDKVNSSHLVIIVSSFCHQNCKIQLPVS
ncbi:RAB [Musa troglodytarum]|uniref:RAB n=1 Tax=Musa troglodytarum TaxID=320322 RepID=A0A9E7K9C7_9LILI|nr:RAB [Musa troglodytarum]